MKTFIKVMKALSDPNRVKIIKLLQQRTMCVCELQAVLGIAQPTVSKHLKILEEAGLVEYRKEGLWVNYDLSGPERNPYATVMLDHLQSWLKKDPEINSMIEKISTLDRTVLCKK